MSAGTMILLAVLLIANAGCAPNPVEKAKERLAFVKKAGTPADICEASKALKDAYRESKDELGFLSAAIDEDAACKADGIGLER